MRRYQNGVIVGLVVIVMPFLFHLSINKTALEMYSFRLHFTLCIQLIIIYAYSCSGLA